MDPNKMKIKVTKNGPYLVTGGVPLSEKIIVPKGHGYEWREGRVLPQAETYALCRCGHSKNPPFCDGSHIHSGFAGEETASKKPYAQRAQVQSGPDLDLMDDGRCAFARFCHRAGSDAWNLTDASDHPDAREEAIQAACGCPSGRLTALSKDNEAFEPSFGPAIEIIQDSEKKVGGGIFVKGGIPVESADGQLYERRNRLVLCRCGGSKIKPFCDASHIVLRYKG